MRTKNIIFLLTLSMVAYWFSFTGVPSNLTAEQAVYTSGRVCGECHNQIYQRWKNSMHALAVQDPIFDNAYNEAHRASAGEAKYLCLKCHAPTTYMTGDYDLELQISIEGVTCDFCHSVYGIDLGNHDNPYKIKIGSVKSGPHNKDSQIAAHDLKLSTALKRSEFCAGCHEYKNTDGVPVLSTYTEWLASPYAEKGIQCQHCHMPIMSEQQVSLKVKSTTNGGIVEHNLSYGHSLEQIKKAVNIEITNIERKGKLLRVFVAIVNVGSGHMVPTGLPSRKLVLKVEVKTADGTIVSWLSKIYQKVLVDDNGKVLTRDSEIKLRSKKVLFDNRLIPQEEREEEFTFELPQKDRIYYVTSSVSYLYEPGILQYQKMELVMDADNITVK